MGFRASKYPPRSGPGGRRTRFDNASCVAPLASPVQALFVAGTDPKPPHQELRQNSPTAGGGRVIFRDPTASRHGASQNKKLHSQAGRPAGSRDYCEHPGCCWWGDGSSALSRPRLPAGAANRVIGNGIGVARRRRECPAASHRILRRYCVACASARPSRWLAIRRPWLAHRALLIVRSSSIPDMKTPPKPGGRNTQGSNFARSTQRAAPGQARLSWGRLVSSIRFPTLRT